MAQAQGVVHRGQRILTFLAVLVFTWVMVGCAKPTEPTTLLSEPSETPHLLAGPVAEVSPPETLETLKQVIDAYTPQVRILSPRPGEVVDSTTVSVRFQVRGLPLFKDETWQLGPHLHVFLDDQPYQPVYDASEPLVFEDLAPGTHTLRVFASRPWHESFKNQGAFDQRTFHVVAPTPQNEVNASAPLLTYSRPQGRYGAEPILLDFYLTNAPLHLSAQDDGKDDLHDWRIRCTVNGQSFVFDQWQPIYLKGFQPGRNWVQLELIDETGHPIENRFNTTVRVIDYEPGGNDTLSQLVRGELDLAAVASIVDPTYTPPPPPVVDEPSAETPLAGEATLEDSTPALENQPEASSPEPFSPETWPLEEVIPDPGEGSPAEVAPGDRAPEPAAIAVPSTTSPAPLEEEPLDASLGSAAAGTEPPVDVPLEPDPSVLDQALGTEDETPQAALPETDADPSLDGAAEAKDPEAWGLEAPGLEDGEAPPEALPPPTPMTRPYI